MQKQRSIVPTSRERDQLYKKLEKQTFISPEQSKKITLDLPDHKNQKCLNKEQLNSLLLRLTKSTKRDYQLSKQAEQIVEQNMKFRLKRIEGQKVENRLIKKGNQIELKKEIHAVRSQQQYDQKYVKKTPQITSKSKLRKQEPISKRLNSIIEEKLTKKQKLKEKYQPSFKPSINPYSEFINDLENHGDLMNRMFNKEREAQQRKNRKVEILKQQQNQELTYQPNINQKSRQMAALRQDNPFKEIKKANPIQYSFVPEINKNTTNILKNKTTTLKSNQNCFERLYFESKSCELKRRFKIQEQKNLHSFQPKINKNTDEILASRSNEKNTIMSIDEQQDLQEIKLQEKTKYSRAFSEKRSQAKSHYTQGAPHDQMLENYLKKLQTNRMRASKFSVAN